MHGAISLKISILQIKAIYDVAPGSVIKVKLI